MPNSSSQTVALGPVIEIDIGNRDDHNAKVAAVRAMSDLLAADPNLILRRHGVDLFVHRGDGELIVALTLRIENAR